MARFLNLVFCLFAFYTTQGNAHFLLNFPPTIGFDDTLEATAPCGSFTVNFSTDNVTDFHVGGDTLAMVRIVKPLLGTFFDESRHLSTRR
jgi:hypothetical protein